MPHQVALTVVAPIKPLEVEALKTELGTIRERMRTRRDGSAAASPIQFSMLPNVHFARFVVFDAAKDFEGQTIAPQLALMTNVDAPLQAHIDDLARRCSDGLDRVFEFCTGYPEAGARTAEARAAFLQRHSIQAKAFYVNRHGRSVEQILKEQELWTALNGFLDSRRWTGQSPEAVRSALIEFVRGRPDLAWALQPAQGPEWSWISGEFLHRTGIALGVLLLSPLLLLALPVFAILLRYHEKRDVPDTSRADPQHARNFRDDEDFWAHNQIIAAGLLKPGWFRRMTTAVILGMADYACRHIYDRGFLSGLNTIHFARWVPLDQGRRLFFSSNYDGSLESYMNDFIDKAAWGLNAIFSNGDGFPRTAFLFCKGITDEKAYKRFLPTRQVPTLVWYSAYPFLTTKNIANNAEIRRGLSGRLSADETRVWLRRFGVGNQLPESGRIARFLDRIRWDRVCRCCN